MRFFPAKLNLHNLVVNGLPVVGTVFGTAVEALANTMRPESPKSPKTPTNPIRMISSRVTDKVAEIVPASPRAKRV